MAARSATINADHRAGNVACLLAGEEGNRGAELFRLAIAAGGDLVAGRLLYGIQFHAAALGTAFIQFAHAVGINAARQNLVAAAARRDIALTPSTTFAVTPGHAPNAVRLALASPPMDQLDSGLSTLAAILKAPAEDFNFTE